MFLTQAVDLESVVCVYQRNTNCPQMTKGQLRSRKRSFDLVFKSTHIFVDRREIRLDELCITSITITFGWKISESKTLCMRVEYFIQNVNLAILRYLITQMGIQRSFWTQENVLKSQYKLDSAYTLDWFRLWLMLLARD